MVKKQSLFDKIMSSLQNRCYRLFILNEKTIMDKENGHACTRC